MKKRKTEQRFENLFSNEVFFWNSTNISTTFFHKVTVSQNLKINSIEFNFRSSPRSKSHHSLIHFVSLFLSIVGRWKLKDNQPMSMTIYRIECTLCVTKKCFEEYHIARQKSKGDYTADNSNDHITVCV